MSRPAGTLNRKTRELIDAIQVALVDYRPRTVRGLFYALLDAEHGRPNSQAFYDAVAWAAKKGREAGLIDWQDIVDPGREPETPSVWQSIRDFSKTAAAALRYDPWKDGVRPVVWVEKAALLQPAREVCREYRVPLYFGRGFDSLSAIYLLSGEVEPDTTVLVFGDHDPSGLDIPRALEETLSKNWDAECSIQRVALTLEQVDALRLPPLMVKDDAEAIGQGKSKGDTRAPAYKAHMRRLGRRPGECWELDALGPHEIKRLMAEAIQALDPDMDGCHLREERDRRKIVKALGSIGKR